MQKKSIKNNIILVVLFFLPVVIVLFLYTTDHNNSTLDIVKENVLDLENLTSIQSNNVQFKDHITVLSFLGNNPESHILEASNLKELVYNKFKGFKTFQLVTVIPFGAESKAERLRLELTKYKPLEYWKFIYASQSDINKLFSTLRTSKYLNYENFVSEVYVIDKELNQRGRLDDRTDKEIKKESQVYPLTSYNMSEVSVLKNKMSDDVRIVFTEYRQKRKGEFNSTTRRANDLKAN